MIYTAATKKALKLMFEAHREQLDKSGVPYVFHPFHVAEQMDDEASVIVALLHDVMEDADYSPEDLRAAGFSGEILDALCLMTRPDGMSYMDYIRRMKGHPLAVRVKLADLRHNSDLSRLEEPTAADLARVEKYREAISLLSENE